MLRFLWAYLVYTWGGLHRYFGNQNAMRSEHEAAVRYFTKAYEIDPTFLRVRLERGVLLFRELGRTDEALADFDALVEEDPIYAAPALFNRAMLAQQKLAAGRTDEVMTLEPLYIRRSEAEVLWEKRQQKQQA